MSKFKWYSEGRQGSVWADSLDEAMSIVKSSYPDLDQMVFVVPRVDSPVKVIIESGKENRLARIEFLTDTYGNAAGDRVWIESIDDKNIYYTDSFGRWCCLEKTLEDIEFKYTVEVTDGDDIAR